MQTIWTVRAQRDDGWVTEHESTRFADAWKVWHDSDDTILLRNGRVLHTSTEPSEQLTLETT
jgi:hypothetical protein